MPDITPLFRKYVNVIEEARDNSLEKAEIQDRDNLAMKKFSIKDTFVKECSELLKHIIELRKVLYSLKQAYESEADLTEKEKDEFDTETRLLLQQYFEKLKFLERYENQRQQVVKEKYLSKKTPSFFSLVDGTDDEMSLFHSTNNKYRSGVLQSLSILLSSVSSDLSKMQQERLSRQKELESIDFNAQLYVPTQDMTLGSVSQSPAIETTQDEVKQYNETMSKLSQEQLQILETEHDELLNHKTKELEKVEKLSKTIMEISSLQNEIGAHLQAQTQNIFTLLDDHDDVQMDIQQGNKQLRRAQEREGKSARLIVYLSMIFGLLILFLDYIN
ncbi:LAFE_0F01376g1_1 [Lachancea fermentati]|uniref:LAFE_0F01376g1_1 n=1 Tax=Lachancea fermentati TaxID=4955 RepID=A0A1G4ME78_LACFM|nr:LAFE_0F01376g1_1 [Lachancea fermentati]